jgi:hypothetical protein
MKKVMVFVAVLAMMAFAFGAMAAQKTKAAPAPKMHKLSGAIAKVDEPAKTFEVKKVVTVKGKKEEKVMTFATSDTTKITKGKKTLTFADLKEGMHVAVEYKAEMGKNTAEAIKIATPKIASKPVPKK